MIVVNNSSSAAPNESATEAPFSKRTWIATQIYVVVFNALFAYVLVRLVLAKLNNKSLSVVGKGERTWQL